MARKKSLDRLLVALQSAAPDDRSDALSWFHGFDWRSTRPTRRQRDQAFHTIAALLVDDPDPKVRFEAAHVLTFWFEPRATDALLHAAAREGETAVVRGQAIEGIGNTLQGSPASTRRARAIPELLGWLRDPAIEVRFWSIYAVGVLEVKEARPILEELARTDDAMFENWWRVRDEAADALASWDLGEWPDRDPAWLKQAAPEASA
ncbi:MAG: HEAT repeat domain-containing protein [Byssovorax sp.]